jgi:hypothetical protein
MSALDPIAGISLEYFAELCVKMKDCGGDLEVCARIAEENGVDRASWEAAMNGWNGRMADSATAGQVALAYMPIYQAALAKFGGPPAAATLDEYIEMSALINTDTQEPRKRPTDFDAMYARFNIDVQKWSQISIFWVDKLTKDPQLGSEYGNKVRAWVKELDEQFLGSAATA